MIAPGPPVTAPPLSRGRLRAVLFVVCSCSFLGSLNANLLAPIIVEVASDLGVSVSAAGQLVTAAGIAALPIVFAAGYAGDRYGRRSAMVTGAGILALASVLSAAAPGYWSLFATRLLAGAGASLLMTNAMASTADYFPPEDRSRAVGLAVAFSGLPMVLGWPAVAALAEAGSWRLPFFSIGLGFLLIAGLALTIVPVLHPATPVELGAHFRRVLGAAFTSRRISGLNVATGLGAACWFGFLTYVGAFYAQTYTLSPAQLSLYLGFIGIFYFVGGAVVGPVARRLGDRTAAVGSALFTAALLPSVMSITGSLLVSVLLTALVGAARSIGLSSQQSILLEAAGQARASILAVSSAFFVAGTLSGAAVGGVALDLGGFALVGVVYGAMALLSAGALVWSAAGSVSRV
ncbi:MAG: MFS transporter [Chloroflexi bacterium]|nr:MFS transporter [Chloroflexota bacterium]